MSLECVAGAVGSPNRRRRVAARVELHMVLSFCFDFVFCVSCPVNVALVVSRVFFGGRIFGCSVTTIPSAT